MNPSDVDLAHLPPPEDLGEAELVALYMRVYIELAQLRWGISRYISHDLDNSRRLSQLTVDTEWSWENWLGRADELMPDWWDGSFLTYPYADS